MSLDTISFIIGFLLAILILVPTAWLLRHRIFQVMERMGVTLPDPSKEGGIVAGEGALPYKQTQQVLEEIRDCSREMQQQIATFVEPLALRISDKHYLQGIDSDAKLAQALELLHHLTQNLPHLLQLQLEALTRISGQVGHLTDALEVQTGPSGVTHSPPDPSAHSATSGNQTGGRKQLMAGEQSSRTSPNLEATTATSLDEFAIRYESELKVASLRGAQGVREFLQQVGPQNRIAFVTPPGTDGVFILSLATRQGGEQGKAYVLPGKFLKRPWIEWFQLPVGSYERVEMTIEPATVAREAEGDWHLVKRGIVKQG